jgi:anti-sigma factor RsiW
LIFLAVGVIGRGWLAPNQDALLVQEVQTAHVRSLITSHLTDVNSSDQHTVKPWFSGKLDFSPPVTDLASQGYPLQGGRLDYLNNRSVAALVYQRNKHLINLFIWPSTDGNQAPRISTYNGYHLMHWSQSGMNYWAVSDLSLSELQSFVQLVQQSISSP